MAGHWILKTEPSAYSFSRLRSEGRAVWDGVTNAVALKGVVRAAYPDPKAGAPGLVVVDLEAGHALPKPVPLAAVKADPAFADLALVRMGRLSVVPVPAAQ